MSTAPICPWCEAPAIEARAVIRFRRGDRVLPVETLQWRCPSGCAGPDGEVPYIFVDLETMSKNEEAARVAWLQHFGDPMPASGRSGRPSAEPQDERLQVRLSRSDLERLDRARGELTRSEFVRRAVVKAASTKSGGSRA